MTKINVTIIDYGGSNLRSAQKAFEHVGADVTVTSCPADVLKATKLALPGVGAFGAGIAALRARELEPAIHEAVQKGVPLLGICVGMQFLFDESDEMGEYQGLGLIPGRVTRFPAGALKVPHMGWNQIEHDGRHPLLKGISSGDHAYFVHSYYCIPQDPADIVGTTTYGRPFAVVVDRSNVYGLQFHPEKSQKVGLQILKNYVENI